MNRACSFFYVSLGVLALALAYHFGAATATAQAPSNPVVTQLATSGPPYYQQVVTANGDVYGTSNAAVGGWTFLSNVFSGGPTPAQRESMGGVKVRYR